MREHPWTLLPVWALPRPPPSHYGHFFNRTFYSSLPVLRKPLLPKYRGLLDARFTHFPVPLTWPMLLRDTLLSPGLGEAPASGVGVPISAHARWACLFFLRFPRVTFSRLALRTSLPLCRLPLACPLLAAVAAVTGHGSSANVGPSQCLPLGSSSQHPTPIAPQTNYILPLHLLSLPRFLSPKMPLPRMHS
ncbi:hypothetical protein HJG60_009471 [Phyllostomus discolor]|uniref:Uncharacterized protein n=1 Tax=Phyllostomus discolor TaxID=89673 RepID=A0A833YIX2_9CHIR|nr:hypothetical protein HJG60_009471 [Phyllostomus discolor]